MDFAFTEEQQELRETARAFLAEHSTPEHVRRAMEREHGFDAQLWEQIGAELGWTAVTIPEAYGGLGLGYVEFVALLEVMGESLVCAPFLSSIGLATPALLVAGNEAQQAEHLPGIAEGQTIASLVHTGASGAWGANGIEATLRRDGSDFVLDGIGGFVVDGHRADLLVVAAREEGSHGVEGVSLVVVPATAAGVARRALPTLDQTRRLAELRFSGVRVPADACLGEPGAAWPALSRTLDFGAVALAAEQVGGAQRVLDLSVHYANERVQFGRPIGSFQAIKHRCADMLIAVESARAGSYYAGCVAADGGDELPVVASLAKATASDAYFQCAAEAIQIHGGVGFTWEYDVHLYFKRAKSSETLLGDAAYHRELVAQRIGLSG